MAIQRNYFTAMYHQAGVHFENFTEVKFRDILLIGTGQQDRRLNWDSPGQTGTYGRSSYNHKMHCNIASFQSSPDIQSCISQFCTHSVSEF